MNVILTTENRFTMFLFRKITPSNNTSKMIMKPINTGLKYINSGN